MWIWYTLLILVTITVGGDGDGTTRKCFDKQKSLATILINETEKKVPIYVVIRPSTIGSILSWMMKIYLTEVLGFRDVILDERLPDEEDGISITMDYWRPPQDFMKPDSVSPSIFTTQIELIGWYGWFVPTRFHKYDNWRIFQNPEFAFRNPVNSTALELIENFTKSRNIPQLCGKSNNSCTILLTNEAVPYSAQYDIFDHQLYIKLYDVGEHLKDVVATLLESYPTMFFILFHWYPSELTHSRERFRSILTPASAATSTKYRRDIQVSPFSNTFSSLRNPFFILHRTIGKSEQQQQYDTTTIVKVVKNAYSSPQEYLQLFELFENRPIGTDEFDVACDWLGKHLNQSLEWIKEPEDSLLIGVMLPTDFEVYSLASVFETIALVRRAVKNKYKIIFLLTEETCTDTAKYLIEPKDYARLIGVVGVSCFLPNLVFEKERIEIGKPMVISYIEDEQYSTRGSVKSYNYLYAKFFRHLDWRRLTIVAKDPGNDSKFLVDLNRVFREEGIDVLGTPTIPKDWGFEKIKLSLLDIVAKGGKIILVDDSVKSLHAIVCTGFHLNMTAKEGYVWCFSGLLRADWWRRNFVFEDSEHSCTYADLFRVVDGHFNVEQQYFMRDGIGPSSLGKFAGFLYDACWIFVDAVDRLGGNISNVPEYVRGPGVERFRKIISETGYDGVSGRVSFDGNGSRIAKYRIQQLVGDGYRTVATTDSMVTNSSIVWATGSIPTDGRQRKPESSCTFESLAKAFDVSCDAAYLIGIFIILGSAAIPIFVGFVIFKKEYDKKARKQKEQLKSQVTMIPAGYDLDGLELPRNLIVIGRRIGEGAFGEVYRADALLPGTGWVFVAVKTLKPDSSGMEKSDFLGELEAMKKFDHPNLIKLIGICSDSEPILSIMEFMVYGDLRSYLLARSDLDIGFQRLIGMALDVVKALVYLNELRYVHRDIAARNCLVNGELVVKLSDFGMTKSLSDDNYYRFNRRGLFPVRWMAVESLSSGIFSPASDIWSYGILLYEIVTFGQTPYHDKTNEQVIEYLESGSTLAIPDTVKPNLKHLMTSCWRTEPNERPTAVEIVGILESNLCSVEEQTPILI